MNWGDIEELRMAANRIDGRSQTEIGYIDPVDDPATNERITALVNYEGSYREVEKLALETMARTARPAVFCFELAMSMQRVRQKIDEQRRNRPPLT